MPGLRQNRRLGAALQQALGGRVDLSPGGEEAAPGAGLLANPARARLFQTLLDRPFTHIAGLARAANIAPPSARWHLEVLGAAGLVQSVRGGREVRYFVAGTVEEGARSTLLALRAPLSLGVVRAVARAPGLTVRELARELGVSPQAVLRAKGWLEAQGLVETLRDGKFSRTYPADGLPRFLARRTSGLAASYARVESALKAAGESASVSRRAREEIVFHVGRRGARKEFRLRAQGPLLPLGRE